MSNVKIMTDDNTLYTDYTKWVKHRRSRVAGRCWKRHENLRRCICINT